MLSFSQFNNTLLDCYLMTLKEHFFYKSSLYSYHVLLSTLMTSSLKRFSQQTFLKDKLIQYSWKWLFTTLVLVFVKDALEKQKESSGLACWLWLQSHHKIASDLFCFVHFFWNHCKYFYCKNHLKSWWSAILHNVSLILP